jgi:glutathione S-transferase
MLRILGKATSINVRKVLWICEEIGVAYERSDGGPELAGNPNALVPVIVDGGFVLWESNTIIRYLANKWTARELLPVDPRRRAEVDKWIDWQATEFNNAWRYAFSAIARKNPAFTDAVQIEASKKQWTAMLAILEAQLAGTGGYVAASHFTLADIPIGLSVNRWFMTPMERPSFPAVSAYYERLSLRPAFLKHGRNGID